MRSGRSRLARHGLVHFVKPLEQPVADEVHADRGQDDHSCGEEQRNRIGEEDIAVLEEHPTPVGGPRFNAKAEERQPGEIDQREGEVEDDIRQDDRQHVREDVDEQNTCLRDAERSRRVDIGKRPLLEDRAPSLYVYRGR